MLKPLCTLLMTVIMSVALAQPTSDSKTSKVGGEDLKKLVTGATFRGDNGKFIFRHTYKADGTLDGGSSYSGGDGRERAWDTGKWRIEGDTVCTRFQKWSSQETCREIERVSGNTYRYVGESYTITIR